MLRSIHRLPGHAYLTSYGSALHRRSGGFQGRGVVKAASADMPPIDKEAFKTSIQVIALRVPKKKCSAFMKQFRGFTLDKPKMKCLVDDVGRDDTKLLLLDDKLEGLSGLSQELQGVVAAEQLEQCSHEVTMDYGCFSATQVLRKLLPAEVDVPTSFECVGHIAHLNLKDEQLPYKDIIGQVILDKQPQLKTIVNKLGSIDNEFRVFPMEVIAGEPGMETEVVQHGARFKLDFSKVYWNSRLETEHKRMVDCFCTDDVIVDVMAGIGPFVIPASQKGCVVYANDLNPESVHYMAKNVALNRVANKVHVFKMDGREFVRLLCATPGGPVDKLEQLQGAEPSSTGRAGAEPSCIPPGFAPPSGGVLFQHALMNLPASAVEFLDAFNGAFDPGHWRGRLPMVHVYTFKKAAETEDDIVAKVEHYLGGKLDGAAAIHTVRDVAPNKLMLCVSFKVPEAVAFNGRQGTATEDARCEKRQKIEGV